VVFAEVVKSQQWRTPEGNHHNGWARAPVLDLALHAGVPTVSFLEGAARGLGLPRDASVQCRRWKFGGSDCDATHPLGLELSERLGVVRKTTHAKEGEDSYWSDYGNALVGGLLAGAVVRLATSKALSTHKVLTQWRVTLTVLLSCSRSLPTKQYRATCGYSCSSVDLCFTMNL